MSHIQLTARRFYGAKKDGDNKRSPSVWQALIFGFFAQGSAGKTTIVHGGENARFSDILAKRDPFIASSAKLLCKDALKIHHVSTQTVEVINQAQFFMSTILRVQRVVLDNFGNVIAGNDFEVGEIVKRTGWE